MHWSRLLYIHYLWKEEKVFCKVISSNSFQFFVWFKNTTKWISGILDIRIWLCHIKIMMPTTTISRSIFKSLNLHCVQCRYEIFETFLPNQIIFEANESQIATITRVTFSTLLQSQPRRGRNLFEVKVNFLQSCISQAFVDYFNLV